ARFQDDALDSFQKGRLGGCVHIEAMGDAVTGNVVHQRRLHVGIVVTVVERGTACQEIDILATIPAVENCSTGLVEYHRKAAAIAAHGRLAALEYSFIV